MTLGGQQFSKAYASIETQLGCLQGQNACGANIPQQATGQSNAAYQAVLMAYANTFTAQPFFEASMKPTACAGFASCTAAAVYNELGNFQQQNVWSLWSDLDNGAFNFPRSMMNTPIPGDPNGTAGQLTSGVAENASVGYGNYNA
jgi:hypothetical protein